MKGKLMKRRKKKINKKSVEEYIKQQQEGVIAPTDPEEMRVEVDRIKKDIEKERAEALNVRHKPWFIVLSKVWGVVYVISLFALIAALVNADLLPANFLFGIMAAIGIVSLFLFPMMYFRNIKQSRKIIAMVLAVTLSGVYAYGAVNLSDTSSFFTKVTEVKTETADYYVLVRKDSEYQKLSDLKGKTIGTLRSNNRNYSKAKNELTGQVDAKYKVISTLSKFDNALIEHETEALFIGKNTYGMLCDQEKGFKKKTRILFTLKIDLNQKTSSKQVDVTKESFSVFISGLDTRGKINETSRSDVNMIVTVNPKTHTVLLTSIPRDFLIHLPSYNNAADKLTHTGIYGIQETIGAVEGLTGIDINYYAKVNYSTVIRFVNAIGGIDVISDFEFDTHGQAAQYHFVKGKNHLDGRKALAFARERKAFEDGDVQRNRDQVKVMEAILKKVTSSTTILTKYSEILNSVDDYMEINMSGTEIRNLVKMQMSGGYNWKIMKQNLSGTDSMQTCYSSGDFVVYVMQPDPEQLEKEINKIVGVRDGTVK